jgi:HlyD family secretion protein
MRRILTEFQPDAVEIEQRSVPGGARWTLYLVTLLLISVVLWSCWAEVDEIVSAPGKVISSEPILVVQGTTDALPVKSMTIKFGQIVRPGETLATLDQTFSSANVRQLEVKIAAFNVNIERLMAEVQGRPFEIDSRVNDSNYRDWEIQKQVFDQRQKEVEARRAGFESELNKIEVQKNSTRAEIKNSESRRDALIEVRDTTEELYSKGSKSKLEWLNAVEQVKQVETEVTTKTNKLDELDAGKVVLEKQYAEWLAVRRAEIAGKLLDTHDEISSMEEDLNKAKKVQEFTTIPVPADGKFDEYFVLEVAERTIGSIIQQGEALVKLAPLGAPLVVEMDIPSRDIGKVKIGDTVNIKLVAYSYQKHGYLTGKIVTISEGTEEQKGQAQQQQIPHYKARVSIDDPSALDNVSANFRLIPDMVAECEVKVGRRRVIEFFLYPIWRAFDSSIREP